MVLVTSYQIVAKLCFSVQLDRNSSRNYSHAFFFAGSMPLQNGHFFFVVVNLSFHRPTVSVGGPNTFQKI